MQYWLRDQFNDILRDESLVLTLFDDLQTKSIDCLLETLNKPEFAFSWRMSVYELLGNDSKTILITRFTRGVDQIRLWRSRVNTTN